LFLLAYVKTSALHVVQGRLCSLGQSTAQQWMHVLLPALLAALRALRRCSYPLPAGTGAALRRLGGRRRDRGRPTGLEEAPAPLAAAPAGVPVSPLCP